LVTGSVNEETTRARRTPDIGDPFSVAATYGVKTVVVTINTG